MDVLDILLGSQSMNGKVEIGAGKIMWVLDCLLFLKYMSYLMPFFLVSLVAQSGEILRGR